MGERVNLQSRRDLLKQFAPQYREASSAQKRVLLDTFVQATGYHRGSGVWLLNHAEDVLHAPAYKRASHYGPDIQHALFLVWNAANRIRTKRLIPFLPTLVQALERHEHLRSPRSAIANRFPLGATRAVSSGIGGIDRALSELENLLMSKEQTIYHPMQTEDISFLFNCATQIKYKIPFIWKMLSSLTNRSV